MFFTSFYKLKRESVNKSTFNALIQGLRILDKFAHSTLKNGIHYISGPYMGNLNHTFKKL